MNLQDMSPATRLYRFVARPAYLVKVICQMLLGVGMAIALVVKVYMFVLTDFQCMVDSYTLGNKIRCANTLTIMSYGLALSAGFELAYRMFCEEALGSLDPIIIGICSAFLFLVSSLVIDNASWQVAILLTSLTLTVAALLLCRKYFGLDKGQHSTVQGDQETTTHQTPQSSFGMRNSDG